MAIGGPRRWQRVTLVTTTLWNCDPHSRSWCAPRSARSTTTAWSSCSKLMEREMVSGVVANDTGRRSGQPTVIMLPGPQRLWEHHTWVVGRHPVASSPKGTTMDEEGWFKDPSHRHEARWISDGTPTALVRDVGVASQDEPPDEPITVEMERVVAEGDSCQRFRSETGGQRRSARVRSGCVDRRGRGRYRQRDRPPSVRSPETLRMIESED